MYSVTRDTANRYLSFVILTIILTLVIIRSEGCQGIKNKKNEERINGKEKFRNLTQRNASRA